MGDGAGTLPVPPARAVEAPIPANDPPLIRNARNYRITDADQIGVGSLKQKARDNLAAIEVLQRLERETRSPTADELRQLVRFVGWGGLPQVFDARFKQWKFVVHDYFFAATLEKVRPGGLILLVTSKGTLDKVEGGLRELLSQQADLLGAIRLPNDAFKRNANTEVTTDIVMLRKRLPGESPKGPAWKSLGLVTNTLGETIPLNEYFVARPEMMLGEMRLEGGLYRRGEPSLISNGRDLGEQLAEAIALLPRNVFTPHRTAIRPPTLDQTVPAPENIKPNAYAVVNDRIGIREGDSITILDGLSPIRVQRIR